jgi:two-component system, LuxR family, response regulator FixJ
VVDEGVLELPSNFRELGVPVIVTTHQANVRSAVKALEAGATDFIERPADDETVLTVINDALNNHGRIEHDQRTALARQKMASLSHRERAVLEELLAGRTNKQIAAHLALPCVQSSCTARMLERLGVSSFAEAVVLAMTAQFIPDRDIARH